ncbi:MAG: bifunctional folylpolyglutamate synthase/dihydrofolate synthase [Planctomycetes bacterium]|nr:bifunctional folylpolyglutamate synthase/dihydrofolate synthase [Planctomycetota bacterium]
MARALGRLDELVNWERRDRGGWDRTLEPVRDLLARLGDPQQAWSGVLVTGTKGKGSVASLVAAGLRRAGLSTGLYTSPHVERVTERVVVDGRQVADDDLATALEEVLEARAAAVTTGSPASASTWFDCMTAAAFLHFALAEVDWAVVEVGIGGRLDSTRAVEAPVAVVTNVDLEHTATLGTTRAAIAGEKGPVVSEGGVLVTGVPPRDAAGAPDEAYAVLERLCAERGARLVPVRQSGSFDERNLALAGTVLNELGRCGVVDQDGAPLWRSHLDAEAVRGARLPAREERFQVGEVQVLLDGAHVASSVDALLARCERTPELGPKPKLVLALGREKDARAILKALLGRVDRCLCTTLSEGRLYSDQELAELAHEVGHDPEAWDDPREALEEALLDAQANGGWVLVLGSFYLAGALRPTLTRLQTRPGTR